MKKNLVLLMAVVAFLSLSYSALAQVSLPNPLGAVGDLPTLFNNIAVYVFDVVGGLAVIMFLWAGILFLTSAGGEGQITKARKALIYAAIGLAISLAGEGLIALIKTILA